MPKTQPATTAGQKALRKAAQRGEPSAALRKVRAALAAAGGQPRTSALPGQIDRLRADLHHVRQLRDLADSLPEGSGTRRKAAEILNHWLGTIEPVPVSVAAKVLGLSEPTIRKWVSEGVLIKVGGRGPVKLEAAPVLKVADLVGRLREAGTRRGLLDAVWYRLQDQALLDREDLHESVGQALRGQGRVVRLGPPGEAG
ncbi:hypothetical protein [Longispora albida]|uniref:hypothetical protein n=1 Tax=Longispora albida TaxID=203523 RepID=UPI0003744050|nr:hypothetical protein [Longispora albida]